MRLSFGRILLVVLLFAMCGLSVGYISGCAEKKEDQCQSNLQCNGTEACVTVDGSKVCKAKGSLGDPCSTNKDDGDPPCLKKDATGREIVCSKGKCEFRCETDLDCARDEVCDTKTGQCAPGSSENDAGTGE